MWRNYRRKLWGEIITGNYEEKLSRKIMRRNYHRKLWGEIITENYEEKLSQEIMRRNYHRNLSASIYHHAKNVGIIGILAYPKIKSKRRIQWCRHLTYRWIDNLNIKGVIVLDRYRIQWCRLLTYRWIDNLNIKGVIVLDRYRIQWCRRLTELELCLVSPMGLVTVQVIMIATWRSEDLKILNVRYCLCNFNSSYKFTNIYQFS